MFVAVSGNDPKDGMRETELEERRYWFAVTLNRHGGKLDDTEKMREMEDVFRWERDEETRGLYLELERGVGV
jgi:hypothetical protein